MSSCIYISICLKPLHEVHASAYFSRLPYFCCTQPVASDTYHKWPTGGNAGESSNVRGELGSPGESSSRRHIGHSRLAQQRVRQCLLCVSETEPQRVRDDGLLQSLLRTVGKDWLFLGSANDCGLLQSLLQTAGADWVLLLSVHRLLSS